jgi:hypothetical protein
MRDNHWTHRTHRTDEELMLRLFDVTPEDEHLAACPDCSRRWESIRLRYENRLRTTEVSEKRLAVQRANVLALVQGGSWKFRLIAVPALAAFAMLLLAAVIVFKPASPTAAAIVEDSVVEDIYHMSFSDEPEAIGPVQALFEEQK